MKIGVFICHCGFNIAGVLDVPKIIKYFTDKETESSNLYVSKNDYFCADTGLNEIRDTIKSEKIDRVVIAACTFKMHGELFRKNVEKAGIHRDLVAFANIREQNSWVHRLEPNLATQKAIEQIEAQIQYVKLLEPTEMIKYPVEKKVLIIGGGVAGIHGALVIANAGFEVILVEKNSTIGGHMALFDKTYPTLDCAICILGPLMNEVKDHPNIKLFTYSEIVNFDGFVGNFKVKIREKPRFVDMEKCVGCFDICRDVCPIYVPGRFFRKKAIDVNFSQAIPLVPVIDMDHCTGCGACEVACDRDAILYSDVEKFHNFKVGAVLVSTGFQEYDPSGLREYSYGTSPNVVTGIELERMLNPDGPTKGKIIVPSNGKTPKKVAFALCVGSRNKNINREYCSNVCCLYSMKHALLLKERIPNLKISLYYNDIRANSKGGEEFYNRIREIDNIDFIKGSISLVQNNPRDDSIIILAENTLEKSIVEESYDLLVLATGQDPSADTSSLANLLNISTDINGFLLESHLKIRPTQSSLKGIYLAGSIQGPKDIPQSISQAESAAAKILAIMNKEEIEIPAIKVVLEENKCDLCRLCLDVCDYQALTIEDKKLVINSANCTGCGACTAMCHSEALSVPGFKPEQINKQLSSFLSNKSQAPLIIAFLCNWCSYSGADLAGTSKFQYPTNARVIHTMCSAMVNPAWIVRALSLGADGVLVAGCYEQDCHYKSGFIKTKDRFESVKAVLEELNIDTERVMLKSISAGEGKKFADIIKEFSNNLVNLKGNQ